jgi:hypothetical protein
VEDTGPIGFRLLARLEPAERKVEVLNDRSCMDYESLPSPIAHSVDMDWVRKFRDCVGDCLLGRKLKG